MPESATIDAPSDVASDRVSSTDASTEAEALIEADLLVEDVSIDGMCGVY